MSFGVSSQELWEDGLLTLKNKEGLTGGLVDRDVREITPQAIDVKGQGLDGGDEASYPGVRLMDVHLELRVFSRCRAPGFCLLGCLDASTFLCTSLEGVSSSGSSSVALHLTLLSLSGVMQWSKTNRGKNTESTASFYI